MPQGEFLSKSGLASTASRYATAAASLASDSEEPERKESKYASDAAEQTGSTPALLFRMAVSMNENRAAWVGLLGLAIRDLA